MVEHTLPATNAVVTLDVALPGIVWGWIITMNMWAKSIGTGVLFIGAYLLKKYPDEMGWLRTPMTITALVFIHIFLFFTVIDLHQMFRFWHIFFYPHWTSAITVGAWIATGFVGVLFLMLFASWIKKDEELFNKLMWIAVVLAIPTTLYTATIMAESSARELWQGPTEMAQMMLAALLAGSATILLIGGRMSYEAKRDTGIILGLSALAAFLLYAGEYIFGPMKAEEVAVVLEYIKGNGEYATMYWIGQTFAFVIPMVLVILSVQNRSTALLTLASVSALAGLWVSKHVWLVIPQLLPMS
jgi:Ni/Fe-hydrogenase subunit HybB-like protein